MVKLQKTTHYALRSQIVSTNSKPAVQRYEYRSEHNNHLKKIVRAIAVVRGLSMLMPAGPSRIESNPFRDHDAWLTKKIGRFWIVDLF